LKLGFNLKEIKKMTSTQVNLFLQRDQEPVYKDQIERELNKNG
jgi:hypothetical protein